MLGEDESANLSKLKLEIHAHTRALAHATGEHRSDTSLSPAVETSFGSITVINVGCGANE